MRLKTKKCPKCGKIAEATHMNFPMTLVERKTTGSKRIKYSICRDCVKIADNNRNKKRKVSLKKYDVKHKRIHRKKLAKKASERYANKVRLDLYGLTEEQFKKIDTGNCAICGVHFSALRKRLHIDHDHATGKVRGMLCNKCNLGLGQFNDSVDLLKKAIGYLGDNT